MTTPRLEIDLSSIAHNVREIVNRFGAKGIRVNSPDNLKNEIEQGFKEGGPVIIEVPIERGSETSPWTFAHPSPPRN